MRLVIVHQIPGRTRLRVSDRPTDASALSVFVERLAELTDIETVDFRPVTGSLVVEHPALSAADLERTLSRAGARMVAAATASPPKTDGLLPVRRGLDQVDGLLSRLTAGGMDLRTLTFVVLVGLAVRQLTQGQVLVPAISLLEWAFALLPKSLPEAADAADDATSGGAR